MLLAAGAGGARACALCAGCVHAFESARTGCWHSGRKCAAGRPAQGGAKSYVRLHVHVQARTHACTGVSRGFWAPGLQQAQAARCAAHTCLGCTRGAANKWVQAPQGLWAWNGLKVKSVQLMSRGLARQSRYSLRSRSDHVASRPGHSRGSLGSDHLAAGGLGVGGLHALDGLGARVFESAARAGSEITCSTSMCAKVWHTCACSKHVASECEAGWQWCYVSTLDVNTLLDSTVRTWASDWGTITPSIA